VFHSYTSSGQTGMSAAANQLYIQNEGLSEFFRETG
jgi:hypothetical protein